MKNTLKNYFLARVVWGFFCLSFFLLPVKVYSFSRPAFVSVINFPYFFHIPFCGSVHVNFQEVCSSSWKLLHFCIHCVKRIIQCNLDDSILFLKIIYWYNLGHLGKYLNFFIALFSCLVPQLFFHVRVRNLCTPDTVWSSRHSFPYRSLFHQNLLRLGLAFSRWPPSLTNAYSAPRSVTVDNSKSKEENKELGQKSLIPGWLWKQIVYLLPYQLQSQFLLLMSLQMLSDRP